MKIRWRSIPNAAPASEHGGVSHASLRTQTRHVVGTLGIWSKSIAHPAHLLDHARHFIIREYWGLSERQRLGIDPGKRFYLNGEPEGRLQGLPKGNLAVLSKKTGLSIHQCFESVVRQFLRAKSGVLCATDRGATCHASHIMKTWNGLVMAGERCRVNRMAMKNGIDVRPLTQDIPVETPFRGGSATLVGAVEVHLHEILGLHDVVRQRRWRDQEAASVSDGKVSGRALVDAGGIHLAADIDHLTPQCQRLLVHGVSPFRWVGTGAVQRSLAIATPSRTPAR